MRNDELSAQLQHPARRRWSWRVVEIAGIPIRVHVTLALLLGWIALSYSRSGVGPAATLLGLALVVCVFATITVHELAHALVARRYGVPTREIMLLPIGGIASIEHMPERPRQELAIAIVGPLVNLVIAGVLWLVGDGAFVRQLMWINVGLAVFNLIPAFPMDGGRALRALLAMRMPRPRATEIAGRLGMLVAIAFGVVGIVTNPWLVLIAVVVWLGARQEIEVVRTTSALGSVRVRAAMSTAAEPVSADAPLASAAQRLLASGRNELPIARDGATVGVLTRGDLARGLNAVGPAATVAAAPHHDAIVVDPDELLVRVVDRLRAAPNGVVVVEDHGHLLGLVTSDQLATYAALHTR